MRIVKDPEERKQELIDTAERLFMTKGYDQTAISDIVREVTVSQGAFYYYFESKEDVFVAVLEKNMALLEKDLREISDEGDQDEAVKLNAMLNRFISHIASGKKIMGLVQHGKSATLHQKLRKTQPFAEIAPVVAEVISKGVEMGRFNVDYPLEISYILLMLLASAVVMLPKAMGMGFQNNFENQSEAYSQNVRHALEDLVGRALGISDYKFILQI